MVLEILFGISLILILTLGYTTFNQLQKVERLESWVEDFASRIEITKQVLDDLDSEGKFESDDEIGTVFNGIKDTIDKLNEITETEI